MIPREVKSLVCKAFTIATARANEAFREMPPVPADWSPFEETPDPDAAYLSAISEEKVIRAIWKRMINADHALNEKVDDGSPFFSAPVRFELSADEEKLVRRLATEYDVDDALSPLGGSR